MGKDWRVSQEVPVVSLDEGVRTTSGVFEGTRRTVKMFHPVYEVESVLETLESRSLP